MTAREKSTNPTRCARMKTWRIAEPSSAVMQYVSSIWFVRTIVAFSNASLSRLPPETVL